MKIKYLNIFPLLIIILTIIKSSLEFDRCAISSQQLDECSKIPVNENGEACCYLEMNLNKIATSACVRVKNDKGAINEKISSIIKKEKNYTLDNINIYCNSYNFYFSYILILFFVLFA